MVGHHHAMKELQKIGINITNNQDTTRVTILNADAGDYILNYQDSVDLLYTASNKIPAKATASQMYNALDWTICRKKFGSPCDVTLTLYDAADLVTTVELDAVKRVYEIKVRKLIAGPSASNILVAKTSTTATVTVEISANV